MSSKSLKEALSNCLVSFDCCVRVTDLLEEYALPYNEVHEILDAYIRQQEEQNGSKYNKRFLVHGVEQNSTTEVLTVANGEAKLEEWLRKLQNAESSLYSVQLAGGAKMPAQVFKPMSRCALLLENLELRASKVNGNVNGATTETTETKNDEKVKINNDTRKANMAGFAKELIAGFSTSKPIVVENKNKTSPERNKLSPEKKKPAALKSINKKGINNFFAAASTIKKEVPKEVQVAAAPTPKKMNDFFKKQPATVVAQKQTETVVTKKEPNHTTANTSVQLFTEEMEPETEEVSSDEEDKLEALKRDIITSDHEEDGEAAGTSMKRRRIEDSDDEETPQQKHEKKEEPLEVAKSETYLDEDGFVITIKPKKSTRISPPSKKMPSPSKTDKKAKTSPPTAAKTKQGNIMNFFTKK